VVLPAMQISSTSAALGSAPSSLVLLLKLEPDASLRQESRAKQNQRPTACVLPNA